MALHQIKNRLPDPVATAAVRDTPEQCIAQSLGWRKHKPVISSATQPSMIKKQLKARKPKTNGLAVDAELQSRIAPQKKSAQIARAMSID